MACDCRDGSCVSKERFDQEHRAYIAAEYRYMKLADWLAEAPRSIGQEAFDYALRCVPLPVAQQGEPT